MNWDNSEAFRKGEPSRPVAMQLPKFSATKAITVWSCRPAHLKSTRIGRNTARCVSQLTEKQFKSVKIC